MEIALGDFVRYDVTAVFIGYETLNPESWRYDDATKVRVAREE